MPECSTDLKDYTQGAHLIDDRINTHHHMFLDDCDVVGKRVMDVGCGRGKFLAHLEKLGASDVLGIDPDPENIKSLKEHGINCLQALYDGNTDTHGFEPDVLTMFELIEHVYSPHELIQAAFKHLQARNGTFYVSTPNAFNAMRVYKFIVKQRHHDGHMDPVVNKDAQHIRAFSFGMVKDLLSMHGFKNIEIVTKKVFAPYFEKVILIKAQV